METELAKPKYQKTTDDIQIDLTNDPNETFTTCKSLSHDCLVRIFQFLPIFDRVRCERVCKLWREASLASWYNFKKLDLLESTWGNKAKKDIYFSLIEKVLTRCGQLITHIDLSGVSYEMSWSRPKSLSMLALCPNLKELNLSLVRIGIPQIKSIIRHCKDIDSLSISRLTKKCDDTFLENNLVPKFNLRRFRLSSRGKKFRGYCLKKLSPELVEEITLNHCTGIDLPFMISTISTFKNLHTLNLRGTLKNYDFHIFLENTRRNDVSTLFRSLNELKKLRVLDISCNHTYVDNGSILELIAIRDRLTALDISSSYVTDGGLSIITTSTSLEKLSINNLPTVTGIGLMNVPSLKELECYSCLSMEDDNLIRLLNSSENMEKLDVSGCSKITKRLIDAAKDVVKYRQNEINLKIFVGGTRIDKNDFLSDADTLRIEFSDEIL